MALTAWDIARNHNIIISYLFNIFNNLIFIDICRVVNNNIN